MYKLKKTLSKKFNFNSIMKAIILIACIWMGFAAQAAHLGQDSILLKIDKRNQTLLGTKGDKTKTLKEELTQVFEKKGLVLSDSLWQQIRKVIRTDSEGDSSLSVQIGNSRVKIGVIKSLEHYEAPQKTFDKAYRNDDEKKFNIKKDSLGKAIVFHSDGKEEVRIGLNGIHVKDGKEEVHVDWNGVRVKESNGEETRVYWGPDSLKAKQKKENANLFSRNGMNLNLGLSGLSGEVPQVNATIYPMYYLQTDTELRPFSSRYVSVEFSESLTLVKGKKSAFKLGLGISFDWYNFMFDHNRLVQKANQGAIFQPVFDAQGKDITFSKNKLTVSYINIPIMPHVVFNKNSGVQMMGLGGYVGYRIDSWTKSIEEKTENLSRVSSNFNLNQFRYGLRAEFAFKKLPDLFFNYDLSPLFEKNSSPNLTGFSFGINVLSLN